MPPTSKASKADTPSSGFNLAIGEVFSYEKKTGKRAGQMEANVDIKASPAPIIWSRLHPVKTPLTTGENIDKFSAVLGLTKEQRDRAIALLTPVALKLAEKVGINTTPEEVEKALKKKLKETEEDSGIFRLGADQRMAFGEPETEGFHRVEVPVLGADGKPLERAFLERGSEGMIGFQMSISRNPIGNVLQFPFRLQSVKVTKAVLWEPTDTRPTSNITDFSEVETGY